MKRDSISIWAKYDLIPSSTLSTIAFSESSICSAFDQSSSDWGASNVVRVSIVAIIIAIHHKKIFFQKIN